MSEQADEMSWPCQYCMKGSSLGVELAQYVLLDGAWQPWPLVASIPPGAVVRLPCFRCDGPGYIEAAAKFNAQLEAAAKTETAGT